MKQINENRKGYKKTPVGWIPEEWEVKELKQIGDILSGGTPDTENPEYWNGTINWCTPTDITALNGNKYIGNTSVKITEKGLRNSSAKLIPENSIVVCTRATIGTCAITKAVITTNQGFKNIIPGLNVNTDYLYYMILFLKNQLLKLGNGSTFLEVSKHDFERVMVSLPRNEEQTNISKILCCWDILIDKTQILIELKEKQKKALMQQLLSGKKRLKGFNGKWRKISAGEIFNNYSKKGFKGERLLSVTQDRGVIPRDFLETRVTMHSGDTNSFKLVERGDFVISLRSFQGGIEYSNFRGVVSPAYTVIKPVLKISKDFYKFYFKSYDFIGHLSIAVIGIRDGKQISYEDFCIVRIPYPSYEEQCAISQILQKAEIEINLLKQKLDSLINQKKGLMQTLLTGNVRIKTT